MDRSRGRLDAERRERNFAEYEKHDDGSLPGWTFLLPAVVKTYGICPYLDVSIPDHGRERARWLAAQGDGGETYHREVERLVSSEDREKHRVWEEEALEKLQTLLGKLGRQNSVDILSCVAQLRAEKDSRIKTKRDKAKFVALLQEVDNVAMKGHVDLITYMETVDRWNIRHVVPEEAVIDNEFLDMCEVIRSERGKLNNVTGEKGRQKKQAFEALSRLIDGDFKPEQQGRYFKRWFQLTPEQRSERLALYTSTWACNNGYPAELGRRLFNFINDAIEAKTLKSSDIQWSSKSGLVEGVLVAYEPERDEFTVVQRTVIKGERRRARVTSEAAPAFDVGDMERVNRLMLLMLVSSDIVENEAAVRFVQAQLGTEGGTGLAEKLGSLFERMSDVMVEHPFQSRADVHSSHARPIEAGSIEEQMTEKKAENDKQR